jgi:flagellar protein FliL
MSKKAEGGEKPEKKKGGMMMIVIGAVVLLAVGGGGMFALVQTGVIGGGHAAVKEDHNPKFIRKGEEDPYAPKTEEGEGEGAGEHFDGEGGSEYRVAYYTFSGEFTSNLKDSEALIQIALACSTRRDGRVLHWLAKHELALRSEVLAILADTPEEDVYTLKGKQRLQKRLTAAINHVLEANEGFGGVDQVYFRNFIIQ